MQFRARGFQNYPTFCETAKFKLSYEGLNIDIEIYEFLWYFAMVLQKPFQTLWKFRGFEKIRWGSCSSGKMLSKTHWLFRNWWKFDWDMTIWKFLPNWWKWPCPPFSIKGKFKEIFRLAYLSQIFVNFQKVSEFWKAFFLNYKIPTSILQIHADLIKLHGFLITL